MRRIIICTDGTWNTPDDEDRGKRKPTNVTKLTRAILPVDAEGISQIIYYDEGVGTQWGADKYLGGITGHGLSDNILEAYRFLVNNYQDNDEVYLFGFSRGAYTARSLSGFINQIGLLPKQDVFWLPEGYNLYRDQAAAEQVAEYRELNNCRDIRIKMIGVWDTVGALGIPVAFIEKFFSHFDSLKYQFHDVSLTPNVDYAYQALAIDEHRKPFAPSLWSTATPSTIEMEQRWFAGVHSNIGGGYDNDGLANVALDYIVNKAEALGLEVNRNDYLKFYKPHPQDEMRDSMSLQYKVLGEINREITLNNASNQVIDESVYKRMAKIAEYRPENLATAEPV